MNGSDNRSAIIIGSIFFIWLLVPSIGGLIISYAFDISFWKGFWLTFLIVLMILLVRLK
jgi:hypothetical protein